MNTKIILLAAASTAFAVHMRTFDLRTGDHGDSRHMEGEERLEYGLTDLRQGIITRGEPQGDTEATDDAPASFALKVDEDGQAGVILQKRDMRSGRDEGEPIELKPGQDVELEVGRDEGYAVAVGEPIKGAKIVGEDEVAPQPPEPVLTEEEQAAADQKAADKAAADKKKKDAAAAAAAK